MMYTPQDIAGRIARVLSPDLLSPTWRRRTKPGDPPTTGHCYASAEAAWHLLGGVGSGWKPCVATYYEAGERATHWWLQHRDGRVCDPTASQYTERGLDPPYAAGRGKGFLTRRPSKRAAEIIRRVTA